MLETMKPKFVWSLNGFYFLMWVLNFESILNDDLSSFVPASELEREYTGANSSEFSIESTTLADAAQVRDEAEVKSNENENDEEDIIMLKSNEDIRAKQIDQVQFMCQQWQVLKRANVPSRAMLNTKCKEIQSILSEQGKYVTWQEVIYELLQRYEGCTHIGDLGFARCDQLEAIDELIR